MSKGRQRQALMYAMLKDGAMQDEVAEEFGVTIKAVQNALYKFEPECKGSRINYTMDQKREILYQYHLRKGEKSMKEIAIELSVVYRTLHKWVAELYAEFSKDWQ